MQPHRNLPFSSLLEDAVSNVTPFNTSLILCGISEHPAIRAISTRTMRTGITHRKRAHKPAQPDVLRSPHPGTVNEAHGICRASGNTSARHDRRTALLIWFHRRCRLRLDPAQSGTLGRLDIRGPRPQPAPPCSWDSRHCPLWAPAQVREPEPGPPHRRHSEHPHPASARVPEQPAPPRVRASRPASSGSAMA